MTPSASRRSDVAPFYVMEVMRDAAEREAEGVEVLHLEVGQPATGAPAAALQAAREALGVDPLGYTSAAGMPKLRSRISAWYSDRYGLDIAADRIVVTTGASGGCVLAFLGLFDHGDRVGVLEPGYPCYRNDLQALGLTPVPLPVGHATGFRPTIEQLDEALPLDGLIVASPSNPTGTVLPPELLGSLVAWAAEADVTLVVDEIYHGITYGVPTPSALAYSDQVIVINSFSKYFSMTGWRLGWMVAPRALTPVLEKLAQSLTISAPTLSQLAGLGAFDGIEELEQNVARYRHNRDLVLDGLAAAGLSQTAPAEGAFFVWVDVANLCAELGMDSQALCRRWLNELGIAATPGVDFDPVRGGDFVRLSYAGDPDEIGEAMARLGRWTKEVGTKEVGSGGG